MIREEALRWFEEGNTTYLLPSYYWGHSVLTLLNRFAEAVDIDIQEIEGCAKELDRHFIPSRYPDAYPSGTFGLLHR